MMIQVTNLSKSFENIHAVNNISFTIKRGDVFGLLGPMELENPLLLTS